MQFLREKILYKYKGTNGNYFVMTQITPNAYDRLYDLGITGEDFNKLFTGKQSPYIASKLGLPPDTQPDSFETKPKASSKETAKKVGFGALVGYLALSLAGHSRNPLKALKNLKPFATKVFNGIIKHFKKAPTP